MIETVPIQTKLGYLDFLHEIWIMRYGFVINILFWLSSCYLWIHIWKTILVLNIYSFSPFSKPKAVSSGFILIFILHDDKILIWWCLTKFRISSRALHKNFMFLVHWRNRLITWKLIDFSSFWTCIIVNLFRRFGKGKR